VPFGTEPDWQNTLRRQVGALEVARHVGEDHGAHELELARVSAFLVCSDGLTNEVEEAICVLLGIPLTGPATEFTCEDVTTSADADGDGIGDAFEVGDPLNPTDTDGDGEANLVDPDDEVHDEVWATLVRWTPEDPAVVAESSHWARSEDPRHRVWAVHVVVCDRAGEWVVVEHCNSHHADFRRLAPKTSADCDHLVAARLASR